MDEKTYRIKVNLESGEIEVEGDKEFVKTEIKILLGELQKFPVRYAPVKEPSQIEKKEERETEEGKPYIKEFIEKKTLRSNANRGSVGVLFKKV